MKRHKYHKCHTCKHIPKCWTGDPRVGWGCKFYSPDTWQQIRSLIPFVLVFAFLLGILPLIILAAKGVIP